MLRTQGCVVGPLVCEAAGGECGGDWLPMFSFPLRMWLECWQIFPNKAREYEDCNEGIEWVVYGICAR